MAGLILQPFSVACFWISILGFTTSRSLGKDEILCYGSGQEIVNHKLTCPLIDGQRSRIIIGAVTGDHIGSDDLSRCNGEIECKVHDMVTANAKSANGRSDVSIKYQCVQAGSFSGQDDSNRTIAGGLLEFNPNQKDMWNITTSTNAVIFSLVTTQEKSLKQLPTKVLMIDSNGDRSPLFNTSLAFGAGYGECFTKPDITDPITVLVNATSPQQLIAKYFIIVKGVDDCNNTVQKTAEVLERSLRCSLNSSASATNDSTPSVVNDKASPRQNDDEEDDGSSDKKNTGAIIGVVATLAILCIIICSGILIAKCIKKRRSHERPLLVTSHKLAQDNPDVPLEQFVSAKGYVNVDETNMAFSLSDYRLPSDQGLHNASFTDTIDLDGNEAADSVRPSEPVTSLEGSVDIDQKPFHGTQLHGERSPDPASYEGAFEGSLEQLRHDMTMETSDGGSSEELNQGSLPDAVAIDHSSNTKDSTEELNQENLPDEVDKGHSRNNKDSSEELKLESIPDEADKGHSSNNRDNSEEHKQENLPDDVDKDHSSNKKDSSDLNQDQVNLQNDLMPDEDTGSNEPVTRIPEPLSPVVSVTKDPDTDGESSHSHSTSSSGSLQEDRQDNQPEDNDNPDQSETLDNSDEEISNDWVDGSISQDNDVVDLTADFSEC